MLLCLVMLSTGVAFATSDDAILSEVSDDISIEESDLAVSDTSIPNQDNVVLSESNDLLTETVNVVTNDTFFNYFDESGTLLTNATGELIFEGDFSDLNLNYITIDAPVKFTGDDAVFDDVTFVVNSDNVVIDGFTVTQTNDVSAFTVYGVEGEELPQIDVHPVAFATYILSPKS